MNTPHSVIGKFLVIPALVFSVAACDSGSDDSSSFRLNGTVTNDAGFGKAQAPIEGAVVTASTLNVNGSLNALEGEATTDANGSFALDLETSAELVVVEAASATYEGSASFIRELDKSSTKMAMNTETTGETEVLIESRAHGSAASIVDIITYVDKTIAAEIVADTDIAAEVATAISAGKDGEDEYVERESIDRKAEKEDDRDDRKKEALIAFQASLDAATSTSQEVAAIEAYERALVEAYVDAGFSAKTQARARQSAEASIAQFGSSPSLSADARFSLNKRFAVMKALAVSAAVEASFEAAGASATRLAAVADAGDAWVAETRSASSDVEINAGFASFSSTIEAELAAELGVGSTTIEAANTAISTARTAFDVAMSVAIDAAAVAEAHIDFYVAAEAAAETSLAGSSDAAFGAEVISTLSLSN